MACVICGKIENNLQIKFECNKHVACRECVAEQWTNFFEQGRSPCPLCRGLVFPRNPMNVRHLLVRDTCKRCTALLDAIGQHKDNLELPWEIVHVKDSDISANVFPRVVLVDTKAIVTPAGKVTCTSQQLVIDATAVMFDRRRSMLEAQHEK
jgi:hypothetical protein